MKFCSKCGKEIMDEAVICPNCGCAVNDSAAAVTKNAADDQVSVALCVLAALIPLFGIIYWPVKHKDTPRKAKACGITAIISWAICFVILLMMGY
jgi:uncharacterized membrane protein YvbJ